MSRHDNGHRQRLGWKTSPDAFATRVGRGPPRCTKAHRSGDQGENPRDHPKAQGADQDERQLGKTLKPHAAEVFDLKIGKAPDSSPEQAGEAQRAEHDMDHLRRSAEAYPDLLRRLLHLHQGMTGKARIGNLASAIAQKNLQLTNSY